MDHQAGDGGGLVIGQIPFHGTVEVPDRHAAVDIDRAVGLRPHAEVDGRTLLALSACAAVYCAVTVLVFSALIGFESGRPFEQVARVTARTKVPMAAGNLVIAVATLAGFAANNLWLLALPPALWLLHQTYTYRAHAEEERRSWQTFADATRAQREGWDAIASGRDTLIVAPTGSGKTLAAFLWALDHLCRLGLERQLEDRVYVVYVSPLRALNNDI